MNKAITLFFLLGSVSLSFTFFGIDVELYSQNEICATNHKQQFNSAVLKNMSASFWKQNSQNYGEGILLWGGFDIVNQEVVGELTKKADIISFNRTPNEYILYCRDSKGLFKQKFIKLQGINEEGKYTDENGTVYYIKDLLDTPVKALDIVCSKSLPDVSFFMILRVLIK